MNDPVCPLCLAFYRRERDEDCPLHPQASRFWRDKRPVKVLIRVFVAGPHQIEVTEIPPGVDEAYELLTGYGLEPQESAKLAMAAIRNGYDPVTFADKFIKLREAIR